MTSSRTVIVGIVAAVCAITGCGGSSASGRKEPRAPQPTVPPAEATGPFGLPSEVPLDGPDVSGRAMLSATADGDGQAVVQLTKGDRSGVAFRAMVITGSCASLMGLNDPIATVEVDDGREPFPPLVFSATDLVDTALSILVTSADGAVLLSCGALRDEVPAEEAMLEKVGDWTIGAPRSSTEDAVEPDSPPSLGPGKSADELGATTSEEEAVVEYDEGAEPVPDLDPCSLITQQEWAEWLQVDMADTSVLPLEGGSACGFVVDPDVVRLAVAIVESSAPWIPSGVATESVDVPGIGPAQWVEQYPVPESSTLTLATSSGVLVLEISSISNLEVEDLRQGAIAFALLATGRVR